MLRYLQKEHCTKSLPDGHVVSKTCSNVSWPNHPHLEKRTPCGEMLMKKIRGKSGNIFWYPKRFMSTKASWRYYKSL